MEVSDNKEIDLTFHSLEEYRWETIEVSIDGMETVDDYTGKLVDTCSNLVSGPSPTQHIVRITLTGRGPLHKVLSEPDDFEDLNKYICEETLEFEPQVVVEKIIDMTLPEVDIEELKKQDTLIGYFLRQVDDIKKDDNLKEELAEELKELYSNTTIKKLIDPPAVDEIEDILSSAEIMGADKLGGGA